MADYPGEKTLWDLDIISGPSWSSLWNAIVPNYPAGADITLAAGNEFFINAAADWLKTGESVTTANWIIELAAPGTFELSVGYDTDYSYNPAAIFTSGSQTVTLGPGRHAFPVPPEHWTAYDKITGELGVPSFKIKVTSGSPVLSGAYLQLEGPSGLLLPTGEWEWSDWMEPSPRNHAIRIHDTTVWRYGTASEGGHATNLDHGSWEEIVNQAFTAAKSATPSVTNTTFFGTPMLFCTTSVGLSVLSPGGSLTYKADVALAVRTQTYEWYTNVTDIFQPQPSDISQLVYGREWLGWEFVPGGGTNAVAWPSGWLIPEATYSDTSNSGTTPSVHGDGLTSEWLTVLGSEAPLNPFSPSVPAVDAVPYSPPAGAITVTSANPIFEDGDFPPPLDGWGVTAPRESQSESHQYIRWSASFYTTSIQPSISVVDPDYRIQVPLFELSPDTIGGGSVDPGTISWGDWYVPGWGQWDWFPDYNWDGDWNDYPYEPILDPGDYYIPLPTVPSYHYLPFDLNTNTQLGEIPLEDVSYSHKLSAPGTASFSIPVTPEMLKQQIKQASVPGKTGLYIVRDNQIVWGGIIWKRQYDSGNRRVRFEAGSFESYFDHRFQSNVLSFEDVDQMTIARTLALQAADEMHIDVDPATSGVNRYYNAFYYDFKTIGGEIDSLASLWDGFDWNVRVYLDVNGVVRRRLVWGYPNLGVSEASTTHLFTYPGNIRSYSVDANADKAGNRVWAIGGGQGLDQLQFEARDDAQLAAGWPLLETTTSYKDVFDPPRLEARSLQDLERLRPPVTLLSVEVDPFSDPILGTYFPGDWARFIIEDNWNNPGIDIKRRIVGYNVSVSATSPLDRVTLDIDAGDTT
jgi:hypothetical protein